jgi:hypothetical protein
MAPAILTSRENPAKEYIMAELALCFREKEKEGYHPLTAHEINEVTIAAQGAKAIIHVMTQYAINNPKGEEDDLLGVYGCVFSILEWLMEPVTDYIFEYGGKAAVPEKEKPKTARE